MGTSAQWVPLLEYVDYAATSIDHIVTRSGLTATTVSAMLVRLELQRRVQCCVGEYLGALGTTRRFHEDVIIVHSTLYAEILFCNEMKPRMKRYQ